MLSPEQLKEGLRYAKDNFENDAAPHLHVDKRIIKDLLDLNNKRVLDFGCGMGGMTLWYATTWNSKVTGVDIDENHIQVANAFKESKGVRNASFECRNILETPLPPEKKFDNIFMNDVVEHIPLNNLSKIFNKLPSLLKPGGKIFVSYPPWKSPYASHVTSEVGIPWCQYLPQGMLKRMIQKSKVELVGNLEPTLLDAYESLNKLEHSIFKNIIEKNGFNIELRKSYSLLNRLPGFWNKNIRLFPLNFLITKEFLILSPK